MTMTVLKKHPPTSEFQTASHPVQISMQSELQRKMIHLSSITIPILAIFLPKATMLWLLVPVTLLGVVIELLRVRVDAVDRVIQRYFGAMLRSHEKAGGMAKVSGATWVLLSATICVLIFPRVVTVAGFSVLIISDTVAALFGRRFGRHRFLEKSVEGSSAFVVSAIIVVLVVAAIFSAPWQFIVAGSVAAVVSAVVEAMSYGVNIDDNLTIPLSFGAVAWGLLALMSSPEVAALLAR
jgi:dolichol kinase